MAKIKLGPTVVGILGTVGGITFTRNKSGPYARAWSRGSNPRQPLQSAQRARLGAIPELWRALTPAEQTDWDAFAALPAQNQTDRFGDTFSLSGFGFFTKCNTRLLAMDRATIVGTPVIARPSAPVISSLQLPYLDTQYAKITYPSGEFPAGTDQIIEISQAISIGHQVSPTASKTLKETQTPPDIDSGFLLPYLDRFGPGQSSLKGFTRVFRQTTEGLRSSAGTANFVSTDSPGYVTAAKDYDGLTNFALRGSDWTGAADSKVCLISLWFRIDGGDGTPRRHFTSSGLTYFSNLRTDNFYGLVLRDSVGATILNFRSTTAFLAGPTWHNIIVSIDLSTLTVQLAVDGALEAPVFITAPVDATIDWTRPNHAIGADTGGAILWDGCMAEIYINIAQRIDLTAPNAIRLFVSPDGLPMELGSNGSFPTDSQPIVYMAIADPSGNLGTGGNYVNQAALGACSDAP